MKFIKGQEVIARTQNVLIKQYFSQSVLVNFTTPDRPKMSPRLRVFNSFVKNVTTQCIPKKSKCRHLALKVSVQLFEEILQKKGKPGIIRIIKKRSHHE